MSKKNRLKIAKNNSIENSQDVKQFRETIDSHKEEYSMISRDLRRVIIANLAILVLVLIIYYTDQRSGYLQSIFNNLF